MTPLVFLVPGSCSGCAAEQPRVDAAGSADERIPLHQGDAIGSPVWSVLIARRKSSGLRAGRPCFVEHLRAWAGTRRRFPSPHCGDSSDTSRSSGWRPDSRHRGPYDDARRYPSESRRVLELRCCRRFFSAFIVRQSHEERLVPDEVETAIRARATACRSCRGPPRGLRRRGGACGQHIAPVVGDHELDDRRDFRAATPTPSRSCPTPVPSTADTAYGCRGALREVMEPILAPRRRSC